MINVRHKENKKRLEISINSSRFFLYDRTAEEIGAALFQAYQLGARDAFQGSGFREDVAEELFNNMFGNVDFDFTIPADIRLKEIEDWALMYSDKKD